PPRRGSPSRSCRGYLERPGDPAAATLPLVARVTARKDIFGLLRHSVKALTGAPASARLGVSGDFSTLSGNWPAFMKLFRDAARDRILGTGAPARNFLAVGRVGGHHSSAAEQRAR